MKTKVDELMGISYKFAIAVSRHGLMGVDADEDEMRKEFETALKPQYVTHLEPCFRCVKCGWKAGIPTGECIDCDRAWLDAMKPQYDQQALEAARKLEGHAQPFASRREWAKPWLSHAPSQVDAITAFRQGLLYASKKYDIEFAGNFTANDVRIFLEMEDAELEDYEILDLLTKSDL